jgi:hypothetical protein
MITLRKPKRLQVHGAKLQCILYVYVVVTKYDAVVHRIHRLPYIRYEFAKLQRTVYHTLK